MELHDLVTKLMTQEELATSRIGILSANGGPGRQIAGSAEVVALTPSASNGAGLACELVLADARKGLGEILPAAVGQLCRDGMCIVEVQKQLAETAARMIGESGPYWVAVLEADATCSFVIAAAGIHPSELGPLVADHLVYQPPSTCMHLPQNSDDRRRRRLVRRQGRTRMMALAKRLCDQHGEAARRVVNGIELLVGERPPKPDRTGRNAEMLTLPDIEMEAWPDPERWPRLKQILSACDRYGPGVCNELRQFIGSSSFSAYLPDEYNMNKFQLSDPGCWRAVRVVDWRNPAAELPPYCNDTRQLLSEIARQLSGEVNILRVAPKSALPPHFDDFDCEVYIQIGLSIPSGCGIRVGGQTRVWEEARPVAFNPGFLHEVWNQSERPRDVLAIDTWHPDLTDIEIAGLQQIRTELEVLRQERQKLVRAS